MRKLTISFAAICIVSFLGASEAGSARRSQTGAAFRQVTKGCKWGCFYFGYVDTNYNLRNRRLLHGKRFRAFYVENRGPHALTVMSVAPSSYKGWGCDLAIYGKICNRIGRLERGQRIVMEMIYGEEPDATAYDFRFIDAAGEQKKFYKILLSPHAIPTIVYSSSSRGREPSIRIIYDQNRRRRR